MFEGELSTTAQGNGTEENPYGPVLGAYVYHSWSDVTGLVYMPDPDAVSLYVRADEQFWIDISSDTDYFVHWYEEIVEQEP